jgi:hypothetical protein
MHRAVVARGRFRRRLRNGVVTLPGEDEDGAAGEGQSQNRGEDDDPSHELALPLAAVPAPAAKPFSSIRLFGRLPSPASASRPREGLGRNAGLPYA